MNDGGMNSLVGGMGNMNMYGGMGEMNGYAGRGGAPPMNQNYSFMDYNRGPQGPPQGYHATAAGAGMPSNMQNDFMNQQRRYPQQY